MSLTKRAQADFKRVSENLNEWAVEITFLGAHNSGVTPFVVPGFHTKHHTAFSEMGKKVNTRIASVTVSESTLVELAEGQIEVRTAGGEVNLLNQLITVNDSTDTPRNYIVTQQYPDEKIGCIVLMLTKYGGT